MHVSRHIVWEGTTPIRPRRFGVSPTTFIRGFWLHIGRHSWLIVR